MEKVLVPLLVLSPQVFGRNKISGHADYFGISQDISACWVCRIQVADYSIAYFSGGVPK